jgi:hypothetical protein
VRYWFWKIVPTRQAPQRSRRLYSEHLVEATAKQHNRSSAPYLTTYLHKRNALQRVPSPSATACNSRGNPSTSAVIIKRARARPHRISYKFLWSFSYFQLIVLRSSPPTPYTPTHQLSPNELQMRSPSRTIPSDPPSLDSWPATHLPFASLTPTIATHSGSLKGVVSLQWPFSPSSATMSLLVCEEDVRLRASKGQLRVEFRGASAREVDSKKIQIGDHVELSLEGAEFETLENATPRDVPWQIVFSTRMAMKVCHDIPVRGSCDRPSS